jgi:transcriptional regulator with XRE-family HTH domain
MAVITDKIKNIQEQKKLSLKQLAKLADYEHGGLSKMINAKTSFSEKAIKKILPILEVSKEEFESWILADKYPKEILERAIQIKKEFPYKRKSVLTANIDKILEEKQISRTALAKQINYNQSGFNQIITGKRGMSKSVLEKLSQAFEISQNEILSWIVADKYSLDMLELAVLKI